MDTSSALKYLLDLLSPRSAEAKIVGSKEAMDLVRQMYTEGKSTQEYLPQMYNKIISLAHNRPEEVSINPAPGLENVYGSVADYSANRINYDPKYSPQDMYNPLAHELLHFLNSVNDSPMSAEDQHKVIQHILGTFKYLPAEQLQGYTPPATDEYSGAVKGLLGE